LLYIIYNEIENKIELLLILLEKNINIIDRNKGNSMKINNAFNENRKIIIELVKSKTRT
jgi:hypothetical protein